MPLKRRSSWRPIQSMTTCCGLRWGGRNSGRAMISRAARRTSSGVGLAASATDEVEGDHLQVVALAADTPVVVLQGGHDGDQRAGDETGEDLADGDGNPADVAEQGTDHCERHAQRV